LIVFVFLSLGDISANINKEFEQKVIESFKSTEIARAKAFLHSVPITVTHASCVRSAGGKNDFYSEGDYWWPNPQNPKGKYQRRDGQTNPDNFTEHRHAMIRLNEIVGTLTSAWILTKDEVYVNETLKHLEAWFINKDTMMNPHMLYAQAVWGRHTGRGIGIIDAYHLVEVCRSIKILHHRGKISSQFFDKLKNWFDDFIIWVTTHPYGIKEMNTKNNHAVCWAVIVSSMAVLTENEAIIYVCKKRFKEVLLPSQMDLDGSFPLEIARTKPYGYSLFNIDAFCVLAKILSTPDDDLWSFKTTDGKSLKKGLEFIYPYIIDKTKWPYKKDIYIWDKWPSSHPALLFGAFAYGNSQYLNTYLEIPRYPIHEEVVRNLPIRHAMLWLK
jgi:hypothetical protein